MTFVPSAITQIKLNNFIDLFEKWNRSINLSGASTRQELEEHLEDCLQAVSILASKLQNLETPLRILDVGSGGGFPGVVVALCQPDATVVCLEPVHKKHAFLRTVARELSMSNLTALAERLEDHAAHDYDVAMSRATFDVLEWLRLGAQHVRSGGFVIGFEAQRRVDIETRSDVERVPYELHRKQRALLVCRV